MHVGLCIYGDRCTAGRNVAEFISEPAISITVTRDTTSNDKPLLKDLSQYPAAAIAVFQVVSRACFAPVWFGNEWRTVIVRRPLYGSNDRQFGWTVNIWFAYRPSDIWSDGIGRFGVVSIARMRPPRPRRQQDRAVGPPVRAAAAAAGPWAMGACRWRRLTPRRSTLSPITHSIQLFLVLPIRQPVWDLIRPSAVYHRRQKDARTETV